MRDDEIREKGDEGLRAIIHLSHLLVTTIRDPGIDTNLS
jgi:hypothetical protein